MRFLRWLMATLSVCFALVTASRAQTWQPVASAGPPTAGVPLLLTDGTVLVHNMDSSQWWKLTPDAFGDYVHGTWTRAASLPAGYGPLYYASAVLADGRVFVMGGEYNFGAAVWTNLGALYDPVADTWTPLAAPPGWLQIGDAQCTVLPDGRLMLANPLDTRTAILDPTTLAWSAGATGKTDRNDEEGWTLLPDGSILTVDAINNPAAERFIPSLNLWIGAGATPLSLVQPVSQEIGPAILLPNGTVFATGATGHNAIYTPGASLLDPGVWSAAPDFPLLNGAQLDVADGPACLLPSGHVLVGASPGVFAAPTLFFEYDGAQLVPVPATPNSPRNPSYVGNMLMLPSGQVLYTDFSGDVEIYTPAGSPQDAWRPTITSYPSALVAGADFTITGTQFNGLSQCTGYGDDATNATNYPLVRLTSLVTGHVVYCRTFGHSTMGVATGATPTSTHFTVPLNLEAGPLMLEVVANGIASLPVIVGAADVPILQSLSPNTVQADLGDLTLTLNGLQFQSDDTITWTAGGASTILTAQFLSANQWSASVPASLTANPGSATLQVTRADGTASNTATFTITTDVPAIASLSPGNVQASSPGFTLTVTGQRFRSGDTVVWSVAGVATPLPTNFVDGGTLTAAVDAAQVANAGVATVTVTRANGRVSAGAAFTITPDSPIVTSVNPTSIAAFGPDFTLSVTGSRLRAGDQVQWSLNGITTTVPATVASDTQLTALIPAAAIADGGTASVTVVDAKGQVSNAAAVSLTNPIPTVTAVDPVAVSAGTPTFTITVTGDHFVTGAQVRWSVGNAKTFLTTTYISATTVTAQVPAALVSAPGKASVEVTNPGPGGGGSLTGIPFTIGGAVSLKSMTPSTVSAGVDVSLVLKGGGFLPGATVQIGGVSVAAVNISDAQLTAKVPGGAIPTIGTFPVKVVNPGGVASPSLTLTVQNPLPILSAISPSVVTAGGPSFTLTVTGSRFAPGAAIQWNGKPVATTYVSGTQLQAVIPAASIVKKGTFQITVNNPRPGGGNSPALVLTAN